VAGEGKKKRAYLEAASVGIYIACCVVLGLLGGNWADGKLGTSPLFLVLGLAAGITAAGLEVRRIVKKISSED